jgi:hypothetical protein
LKGSGPGGGAECIMSVARAGIIALALLVLLALAAAATLGVSLSAVSWQPATPSPAEVVASRFPAPDTTLPSQPAMTFSSANVMPVEHWETFDQGALSGIATGDPLWPPPAQTPTAVEVPTAIETTEPPTSQSTGEAAASVEDPAPAQTQGANVPARRVAGHSNSVLNDAQIASLKRRLNLNAEQERMWPAVEAALRKIVYTKTAMSPHTRGAPRANGSSTPYIDPTSAEVRQLKAVAVPLIMRLNDEQKREVKMLAYVMGLESVASQF